MAGIIAERLRRFARSPAADLVLERLRQVPVIERRVGLDALPEQFVDEAVVEVEALGVGLARSFRKHPRPGDREPVGLCADFADQADVFLVAVVVIVGDNRRCCCPRSCPACARTYPRSSGRGRPRSPRPRSGRPRWRCPRRSLLENSQTRCARLPPARRRRRVRQRRRARTCPQALQNAGAKIFETSSSPVSVRRFGRRISCRSRMRQYWEIRRRRILRPRKSSIPSRG